MNEKENTTTQNLSDTVKAVLRGKFIEIQAYLRRKFQQRTKERASPQHFFLRRRGGWGVANSSQMSSGAEAQGRFCFQSLKSPALPTSLFPSAGRCPGRRSQCARFSGRRGGSGGLEGWRGGRQA